MIRQSSSSRILLSQLKQRLGKKINNDSWSSSASAFRPLSTTPTVEIAKPEKPVKRSLIDKLWGKDSSVASEKFSNRWLMAIPAFSTHLCLGAPYAWSLMADLITKENGFVASAATDWTLMQSALPLSIVFVLHGLSGSILGNWQSKVGPRKAIALAAFAFGGGLSIGALGIHLHSLPLLYLGYGVLGGTGIGLAYTPPVQTLIQWFPDKKGIASGIAIAGFGSGALAFTPAVQYLTKKFAKLPTYLGPANDFITQTVDGKLFAEVNGSLIEVINATSNELSKISYTLSEGLYIVGSGSTGASEALALMGATYFATILASSLAIKNPHPTVAASFALPNTSTNATATDTTSAATTLATPVTKDVSVSEAMTAPQFYLLGTTFFCLASGGMGFFSVAKPLMSEVFSNALPALVTSAFAAKFVLMLSSGNLGGRLGWAAISDMIGRRKTFMIVTAGSVPIYLTIPTLVEQAVTSGSSVPLYLFCGCAMAIVSGVGAVFAILPAYESDLFGSKNVGAIHGRMLIASSAASITGPSLMIQLRSVAESKAISELLTKVK
jgi:MFS family permease